MRTSRRPTTSAPGLPAADGELLALFVRNGDQSSFDKLVERHGPMVWRVCQRVLRHPHDAEDAYQATFLLLARHGRRVRASDSLAGWVYRVAFHTALAARRKRLRRREAPLADEPLSRERPFPDFAARIAQQTLLEELAGLPPKYRTPLVMRYLEGRSRREIADETDQTVAAVQGRLARGTRLLRTRLVRRGVSLAVAVTVASAADRAAACPIELADQAVRGAAAVVTGKTLAASPGVVFLYQQGVRAMFFSLIGKPMLGAAAAALLMVGVAAPLSVMGVERGGANATPTLDAAVAEASPTQAAPFGGVVLASGEAPVEVPLGGEGGRLVERPIERPKLVERPVETPQPKQVGPVFRAEDLQSPERLQTHIETLQEAINRLNERIERRDDEGVSFELLEEQRSKLVAAQEVLELHEATLDAPAEYVDSILATAVVSQERPKDVLVERTRLDAELEARAAVLARKESELAKMQVEVQQQRMELDYQARMLPKQVDALRKQELRVDRVPAPSSNGGMWDLSTLFHPPVGSRVVVVDGSPDPATQVIEMAMPQGPKGPREKYSTRNKEYGYAVEQLQNRLNKALDPSPSLDIDGDYGPLTMQAVERFQRERGLKPTGMADVATREALGIYLPGKAIEKARAEASGFRPEPQP